MSSWEDLAASLASLPEEDRARFAHYAGIDLPGELASLARTLQAYERANPAASASDLLATTAAQAAASGESDFARAMGSAALDLARTPEERQLAHVSLAQACFGDRREEASLRAFEEHCRAAIDLGHAGTFCYERLAVLYEYRGDVEEAAGVCRRAAETLEASGDSRSAERFRKRLKRLSGDTPG